MNCQPSAMRDFASSALNVCNPAAMPNRLHPGENVLQSLLEVFAFRWLAVRSSHAGGEVVLACRPRQAVHSAGHPVRPPRRRLRRQDDQHAPPLGRGGRPTTSTSTSSTSGDFIGAVWPTRSLAETLTRVLYPDDSSTASGQGLRFVQEYFLVACSLPTSWRASAAATTTGTALLPDKVAIQTQRHAPRDGRPRVDAHPARRSPHLGWDEAWDLTQRTLAYTNHTLLPEALEKWPASLGSSWLLPRHLEIIYEINRRFLDDVRREVPGGRRPRRRG